MYKTKKQNTIKNLNVERMVMRSDRIFGGRPLTPVEGCLLPPVGGCLQLAGGQPLTAQDDTNENGFKVINIRNLNIHSFI